MANVLVIDDRSDVRESLRRLLEGEGYAVQTTECAETGLATARSGNFDVVIIDFQMPGANGLEVIRTLHATQPQLPIILLTAHHSSERAIEATKLGAYDYVIHPIDPATFLKMVERAIEIRRLMVKPVEIGRESSG